MNLIQKEDFYMVQSAQSTGTGALLLTVYLDHSNSKKNYIKLFVLFTVIFSLFEYLVGFALDALFAERWWDYSDEKYNINGRITILNSFFWGVITIVFTKFIYPLIKKFKDRVLDKIPLNIQFVVAICLVSVICVDFVFSCIKYLK